jgi:hypothetical protein
VYHYSSHFLDYPVFLFYNNILLWGNRSRELLMNTRLITKLLKTTVLKSSSMIVPNPNSCTSFLILKFFAQGLSLFKSIRLLSQYDHPSIPSEIIHNNHDVRPQKPKSNKQIASYICSLTLSTEGKIYIYIYIYFLF